MMRILFVLGVAAAFNRYQVATIRRILVEYNAPPPVVVIDSVFLGEIAWTVRPDNYVYVDGAKLACCPNTFANVVTHEIFHTKGYDHNTIPNNTMSYRVTEDINGNVVEDPQVYPANLPTDPQSISFYSLNPGALPPSPASLFPPHVGPI